MRLAELIRPYLEGRDRIVDATPPAFDLRADLFLTTGAGYVRIDPSGEIGGPFGGDTLVLVVAGPDPGTHGDPDLATRILGRLGPGGRAALLFGWGPADLPYARILPTLAEGDRQVRQIAQLESARLPSAAIVEQVVEPLSLLDGEGRPIAAPPTDPTERRSFEIALINELAFAAFAERALRLAAVPGDSPRGQDRTALDRRRAQQRLETADAEIRRLQAKIEAMEESTSLEVGRVVVNAARSPKNAVRLPIDLARAWRRH